MSNLVVVAIPEEQDRVWKVSSEEVPHMTLLFLGEEEFVDTQQIMEFVDHAVTVSEHGQFYATVDRRGTLGEDDADVIFFKNGYDLKWITQFRNQLLQNDAIRMAYDSTDQYDGWTPHLTLGYPETPAKPQKDGEDYPLYSVCFDRIAVWADDYSGPEFRLEWPERELMGEAAVAYSDVKKAGLLHCEVNGLDAMEHFGIKGMKWGINRDFAKSQRLMGEAKALEERSVTKGRFGRKLDQRKATVKRRESVTLKHVVTSRVMLDTNRAAKKDIKALHKKPEFQNINYRDENGHPKFDIPKYKALEKAESQIWMKHLNNTVSGYKFDVEIKGNTWDLVPSKIEHDESVITVRPIRDANSFLVDVELVEDSMKQTAELGAEFIEHHGVKGQKWGVRNIKDGPEGSHIRVNSETGKAKVSKASMGGVVAAAVLFPLLSPLSLLHPRVRAEMKAAREVNKGVKADKKWHQAIARSEKHVEVHNKAADEINSKVAAFNNDKRWKNADGTSINLTKNPAKQKEYDTAVERELINPAYSRAAIAVHGSTSPGGRYKFEITDHTTAAFKVTDTFHPANVKHAAGDEEISVSFTILRDANGHITGFKLDDPENAVAIHTVELGEAFIIEHFGIKGMRWGFSNKPAKAVEAKATSRIPKFGFRPHTKIDVEGGENHHAHTDAIKVAVAKVKLKKSGPAALSNQELRDVANRVQLENQVALLTSSKGKKFVSRQLEIESQNLARDAIRTGVGVGVKKVARRAAAVGALAL